MRIRSFHIDAFGTLRDVTVEGLPEAGAVFLGHNEAGKSTLLDFFRSTLVGYPRTRDARERGYLAGQSGLLGGGLTLFSDACDGDIRLIRRPNVAKGEPLLTDAEGRPLDPALWGRLLGGVTREVYASVYGFSLSELQSFASLTSEGVRNALYGASFGMAGLKSPGAALKKLTGSMEDLFRARGSNPRLSAALKEWDDVRRDMRRAEEDAARYDSLAAERDAAQGRLAALRAERTDRERERRMLERRLGVWERWEEWRLAGVRLERLEPVPATFPQDGPARLERALERRSDVERALEQARQRLEQAREDLGSRVADRALLDCGERLRELAGRTASCRNALAAIPGLCADRERTFAALQRELAGLGPDWTAERVQRIGRPLSLREVLERQAEQRRSAVSDMENAQAAVRRIAEDTKALESELEEQMRQAADVPEPPMALSEAERERLREAMARAEEARRRLPEAQTSSAEAERELDQALSRLALEPGTSGRALEALSAGQDVIAALASEILHKEIERKDRERRVAAADSDVERAGETLARLRERRAACPARSAVDAQWAALRRLRSSLSRLAVEHVRFTDAESRCAEHRAVSGTESSPVLVVLGSVLAVLGGAGAVLRGLSGIAFLRLGSVALPLESWLLGTFLLVGGAFVWAGFPRRKERRPEFTATAERLQQRRTACLQRVQAVQREIGELCRTVGLSDAEDATVDAFERAVELARERCAAGERLAEEIQRQEAVCAEAERHAQTERAALEQASADERAAMARWLAWFQTHGVDAPLPGEAAVFCARVDSARMRLASALAKRRELAALEADRAALPECVRSLLSEAFYSGDDDIRAAEAARNALDLCREADRLRDERRRLEESVQAMTLQLTRLEQSRLGAEDALEAARARQVAADAAWEGFLGGLGLAAGLSPATAREALERMDRVQALEAERLRLDEELERQERERDALRMPLREILRQLGRLPDASANNAAEEPDWPGCLEALLREWESARAENAEVVRLRARSEEQAVEVREAEAVHHDAVREVERLLNMAQVSDAEAFYRRHGAKLEREALERRREDLEDALRLAARDLYGADADIPAFFASFGEADKEVLEAELASLAGRLSMLTDEEERLADSLRTQEVRLEQAEGSETLSRLRLRAASLSGTIRGLGLEWSRYALARHLLLEARGRFEKERQPGVIRAASALFSAITGGAWVGIAASLEDSSLRVLPPHGEPVSPEVLSRGTQEQLYLALRLAHIRNHAAQAAALPVIMDDVLVNFDPDRALRTAQTFGDLASSQEGSPGHQLLYFTCHPHMADMLRKAVPGVGLYVMERGTIREEE